MPTTTKTTTTRTTAAEITTTAAATITAMKGTITASPTTITKTTATTTTTRALLEAVSYPCRSSSVDSRLDRPNIDQPVDLFKSRSRMILSGISSNTKTLNLKDDQLNGVPFATSTKQTARRFAMVLVMAENKIC